MTHPPFDGATILVTGASAGIGREIARHLPKRAGALCESRAARS
jgi:short-subunit dehydrogenase